MKLFEIKDFITSTECNELISYSITLQRVNAVNDDGTYRIANGIWLNNETDLTNSIKQKISHLSNLPIENQEKIHIVKYDVGGLYKPHHDYFELNELDSFGNRIYSFLIYLNDDYIGGKTKFDMVGRTIQPLKGKLVYWKNVENGNLLTNTLHSSTELKKGEKWIAIVWVREHKLVNPN